MEKITFVATCLNEMLVINANSLAEAQEWALDVWPNIAIGFIDITDITSMLEDDEP